MKRKIIALSISFCLLLSPIMANASYGITVARPAPVSRSITVARPSHVAKIHTPKASTSKSSSSKAKSSTAKNNTAKSSNTTKNSNSTSSNITKSSSASRNYSFNPFNRNFFLWVWLFGYNDDDNKEEKESK